MTENTGEIRQHLQPEEVEALALEAGRSLPAHGSAHVTECARCSRDVTELRRLHGALVALSPLVPAPGLADRVMRRVRLPLPWRVRVLAALRQHWIETAAAFAGLAGAIWLGAAWAARYPEVNPVAVATFLVESSVALLWGAVMEAGRFVYGSGILATAEGLVGQLTLTTAFLAVATVTLVGLGALRIMWSLVRTAPGAAPVTRG
jgi:hypothetical protein